MTLTFEQKKTRQKKLRQKKLRKTGIGGSEVAAILGLSPWKTAVDVYLDKISDVVEKDESNERQEAGNMLEDALRKWFERRTGKKVIMPVMEKEPFFRHAKYPFLFVTPDGLIEGRQEGLELKNVDKDFSILWPKNQDANQVPKMYQVQCMHGLEVMDYEEWSLAPLIGGNDFRIYEIKRNKNIGSDLIELVVHFWENHVLKRIPPAPSNPRDTVKLYPAHNPELEKIATKEVLESIERIKELRKQIKVFEQEEDNHMTLICNYMKDAEFLKDAEKKVLATWKSQSSNRFDTNRFKQDHSALYGQYLNNINSRVFRFKGEKK